MKTILRLAFLIFSINLLAQAPSGYYSSATGTGYTLKTQLYNIIKGHTDRGYSGLWTTYSTSDRDHQYENDNSIIDIYSENPSGTDPYHYTYSTNQCGSYSVEGDCYNREHIIPQSVFNEISPMVSDAHHIPPTDGKVNGMRSNYPHGTVSTATWTSGNGSKLGSSSVSGYSGTVFEPINEFKGDIARMYFYFATRYENTISSYSYAMFNGTSNQVFTTSFLNLLIQWHNNDPVSAREIERNNAIYARQGNRNPFIDDPSYVGKIWGGSGSSTDTQAPSVPSNLSASNIGSTSVSLSWSASTDNIGVTGYLIYRGTTLVTTVTSTSYNVTGLVASTAYSFSVKAKDAVGNLSSSSNILNVTTNGLSTASDLFISEYVEGSSNNKAIEIKNNTGGSINLSSYQIKKQTNGSGSWSSGLTLSGTLANGGKFVIVNSSISSTCYSKTSANISSASSEMTFNGNDPVGLFKNGVLIDIVGTFNGGSTNFAADATLRRKTSLIAPKSTYSLSDWEIYYTDTCSGLGNRISQNTPEDSTNTLDFLVYPNPNNGNFSIELKDFTNVEIEIYNSLGQEVFQKKLINNNTLQVDNLSEGLYFVRISNPLDAKIKKIIVE